MNKEQYSILLKTKKWKDFAYSIKKRDGFKCKKCGCKKFLQAHHKVYIKGRKPWEYDMSHIETLCDLCHKNEHKGRTISSFIINRDAVKGKKKNTVVKKQESDIDKKRKRLIKEGKLVYKEGFQMKLENSEDFYKTKPKKQIKRKNKKTKT